MRKPPASVPSVRSIGCQCAAIRTKRRLTYHRHDLHFLAKHVLVARCDPLPVRATVGHTADAYKHVAGRHDKGSQHDNDGPSPARAEDGRHEAQRGDEGERHEHEGCGARPVKWWLVRDRDGRVVRELLCQGCGLESPEEG